LFEGVDDAAGNAPQERRSHRGFMYERCGEVSAEANTVAIGLVS
jgi:hypothetical protein